ncbi:MAG: sigma 54-interacting transcriptional regulator, partial [Novipirellula sp. JB048]
MTVYLTVRSGPEKGRQFTLDRERPMHIGRGKSCEIMLTDPVSSRFHAVIYYEDGNWHLRDTSSRNGTLVNDRKTDHARLLSLHTITIGGTELQLVEPEQESSDDASLTHAVSFDSVKDEHWAGEDQDPIAQVAATGHLIDLYTLSLSLLRCENPDEVISTLIELLRDRTQADVVGISFDAGEGRLKPRRVEPPDAANLITIEKTTLRRIIKKGDAVWINDPAKRDASVLRGLGKQSGTETRTGAGKSVLWSDIILAPIQCDDSDRGVLQLYRREPQFNQSQFELTIAAARLLSIGLSRAFERDSLKADRRRIADRNADSDELVGSSAVMQKLKERIERVGKASGSVLIRGESGVGKELVARAVHRSSLRSKRPMLTVNCAAIPPDLIESQLFGHRKGSFTGADSDHIGWFQQAHTGTLFLDEVGELTLDGQAKLLRILEGHPFLPVGATEEVLVDVRVIAATNRDLAEFVREKRFREDLFYRLSVFELVVPPLRDRGEDLERLVDHFLDHFRRQHGRPLLAISDEARSRLLEYAWPGNVRQLR